MSVVLLIAQWLLALVTCAENDVHDGGFLPGKPTPPSWDPCAPSEMEFGVPKTDGDNGFMIRIAGVPQPPGYQPNHVYTVSISSTFRDGGFQGFSLVAVPIHAQDHTSSMGIFQVLDPAISQMATRCPQTVMHTAFQPLGGVSALWVSPPPGSGCVEFRATVIENSHKWFRKDGALTKVFCEIDQIELNQLEGR